MGSKTKLWCQSGGRGNRKVPASLIVLPFVLLFILFAKIFELTIKIFYSLKTAACKENMKSVSTTPLLSPDTLSPDNFMPDARQYEPLVEELSDKFPMFKVQYIGEGPSDHNINFRSGSQTMISVRARETNAAARKQKFAFNSDRSGLAVGFKKTLLQRISIDHLQYIDQVEDWVYYRISNSRQIQLLTP